MNWKIILLLTLLGVLMAILSLFGMLKTNYFVIYWIVLALVSGFVIGKKAGSSYFMHGVVSGLFIGIVFTLIQSVFFDTYLMNNPNSLDGFKNITTSLQPQYVLLFSGPFIGIAFGIVAGLIAMMVSKSAKKSEA